MVSILGANSVSGGYEVSNSLRFNDDDTASLNITQSAGNRDTWTFSAWIKRGNLGTNQVIIISGSGDTDYFVLNFNSSDKISWHQYNGSNYDVFETSDAVFRDPSAWYHIVLKVDTTDSTADNRVILYVNGSVASHTANTTFDQNEDTDFNNNGNTLDIGNDAQFNIGYAAFDGYMAEINFIDGTAKAQTDFGEFDDNGVWIPKEYTGSYGTNGFFLEFQQTGTSQNASGIGADTSGQDNHFAVTNLAATDVTTDTCTNNFATLNPLDKAVENAPAPAGGITLSEGNLEAVGLNGGNRSRVQSTIGVSSGKWYAEFKIKNGNDHKTQLGIIDAVGSNANHGGVNHGVEYRPNDDLIQIYDGGSNGASQTSLTGAANDNIVGIALDVDASTPTVQFYLQGSALGNAVNYDLTIADRTFFFYVRDGSDSGSDEPHYVCNFGSPPYTVSSGNADANGHGNFEYAPPSGYFALCTKNLAEFG